MWPTACHARALCLVDVFVFALIDAMDAMEGNRQDFENRRLLLLWGCFFPSLEGVLVGKELEDKPHVALRGKEQSASSQSYKGF